MPVKVTTRALIDFELGIGAAIADQTIDSDWGRAFLTPSMPKVWDATSTVLEAPGMTMVEVAALADEVLGDAGFVHRTVAVPDAVEGARLAAEIGTVPGWEAERLEYMVWRGESGREPAAAVREARIEEIAALRAELTGEFFAADMSDREETIEQLVERERRSCRARGDRWFLAPAEEPTSSCQLLAAGAIGQVESVGTLQRARGKGAAQAVTIAATRASREAGHEVTFLSVDADDWPLQMYAKLGYETIGELHVLRCYPT
jgi:hypothetical protein